jgi:hypothetical protein
MFKIKYRIVDDFEQLKSINGSQGKEALIIEGFFMLCFDEETEGYFHDNQLQEGEEGFESLITWFELLAGTAEALKGNNYVLLSIVESYNAWLEFKAEGDSLKVRKVLCNQKEGSALRMIPLENFEIQNSYKVRLSKLEFFTEIKEATRSFINNLNEINPLIVQRSEIQDLEKRIENLI